MHAVIRQLSGADWPDLEDLIARLLDVLLIAFGAQIAWLLLSVDAEHKIVEGAFVAVSAAFFRCSACIARDAAARRCGSC